MDMASISSSPRTVEDIFKDYSGRRSGIVRAPIYDVTEFYGIYDPEKENLCLYGHPNDSWEVTLPAEEVPLELPEPALGINFARDGVNRKTGSHLLRFTAIVGCCLWLFILEPVLIRMNVNYGKLFVAMWTKLLLSYTSYNHFNDCSALVEEKRLFSMINELPTVFEVVTERKPAKDKPSADSGTKSKGSTKRTNDGQVKSVPKLPEESYEEEEDEHGDTQCGTCGGNYNADEFWIGCDICERRYHGKCVKITPAKAESIKQYTCPSCSIKRGRQ